MTLEQAVERVLKIQLAAAGLTLSQWARNNDVERKTAAYQFQKGAASNLATLQRIAGTFGVRASSIIAEAERLIESEAFFPKPSQPEKSKDAPLNRPD